MPTAGADLRSRLGRAKAILDLGAIVFFQKNPCGERTKLCPIFWVGLLGPVASLDPRRSAGSAVPGTRTSWARGSLDSPRFEGQKARRFANRHFGAPRIAWIARPGCPTTRVQSCREVEDRPPVFRFWVPSFS